MITAFLILKRFCGELHQEFFGEGCAISTISTINTISTISTISTIGTISTISSIIKRFLCHKKVLYCLMTLRVRRFLTEISEHINIYIY